VRPLQSLATLCAAAADSDLTRSAVRVFSILSCLIWERIGEKNEMIFQVSMAAVIKWPSSGILHHAVSQKLTDVSEVRHCPDDRGSKKVKQSRNTPWWRLGEEVYLLLILDLGTRWGEWSASRPGRALTQGKDPRYPLYMRLGGPQSRSGHRG
jgi:hypothetical protein